MEHKASRHVTLYSSTVLVPRNAMRVAAWRMVSEGGPPASEIENLDHEDFSTNSEV